MKLGDWGSILGATVALVALLHSVWVRRRLSDTAIRATNADLRAEEALKLAKEVAGRDSARFVNEQAELEAPQIADGWIGQMQNKWGERSPSDHYVLSVNVASPAARRAVEIIRSRKESLYIVEISLPGDGSKVCRISGWNRAGYHRRFGSYPPPPGKAAS